MRELPKHLHSTWRKRAMRGMTLALSIPVLTGCATVPIFNPSGFIAERIENLWWFMFITATAVFLAVVVLLLIAITRRNPEEEPYFRTGRTFVVFGGVVIPAVIVFALMGVVIYTLKVIEAPSEPAELVVEVYGQRWWWEINYPQYNFVTANEIHIPLGEPVILRMTSPDVIHSFWVPELMGKRDLVPGITAEEWFRADEPGSYRGLCAEFCGLQHAHMMFLVIAEEQGDFEAWIQEQQQGAVDPEAEEAVRGRQVFFEQGCAGCHTVRGTNALGEIGPDLTHLASRLEIGAGSLNNTHANLAGWTTDAQHIKSGIAMPPSPMPPEDLIALLSYLETLQ